MMEERRVIMRDAMALTTMKKAAVLPHADLGVAIRSNKEMGTSTRAAASRDGEETGEEVCVEGDGWPGVEGALAITMGEEGSIAMDLGEGAVAHQDQEGGALAHPSSIRAAAEGLVTMAANSRRWQCRQVGVAVGVCHCLLHLSNTCMCSHLSTRTALMQYTHVACCSQLSHCLRWEMEEGESVDRLSNLSLLFVWILI